MLLADFLLSFGSLADDEFLRRFPRPFLLQEDPLTTAEDRVALYLVGEEDDLVVGRGEDAQFILCRTELSKHHAAFQPPKDDGPWHVVDLGSTNGTTVDGERLKPHRPRPLEDGSEVCLGAALAFRFVLPERFLRLALDRKDVAPLLDTQIDGDAADYAEWGLETAATPTSQAYATPGPLYLCCPPLAPAPLEVGSPVVVGRSSKSSDFVLLDAEVSRRHAEIVRRKDGVFVRDLSSRNGVRVGSPDGIERSVASSWVPLTEGSYIAIQGFILRVEAEVRQAARAVPGAPPRSRSVVKSSLANVPLESLLRSLEDRRKSGVVEITTADGRVGRIAFFAGHPLEAKFDGLVGVDAIAGLLELKEGSLQIGPAPEHTSTERLPQGFREILRAVAQEQGED